MKIQTLVSSVALSLALVAGAQAGTPRGDTDNTPFQGVYGQVDSNAASRSQVAADLAQARAAGLTGNADVDNAPFTAQADVPSVPATVAAGGVHGDVAFGDLDNQPFQGV
ncbi:DUF4148 domain-containing protein [Bordetella genomosp. 11]|uniref:DUF4148 domain-containing protein n=1 Tax=Bordetella genomosp. 11 TaxID=1416808 RepID=A0A261UXW9_9BORD|nr:DUF4148 domain-containing protein [Bordetella genomosp. 11]OZI66202.1 hypothetical protein CAL28_00125 [Bordetella genomosp. 11]